LYSSNPSTDETESSNQTKKNLPREKKKRAQKNTREQRVRKLRIFPKKKRESKKLIKAHPFDLSNPKERQKTEITWLSESADEEPYAAALFRTIIGGMCLAGIIISPLATSQTLILIASSLAASHLFTGTCVVYLPHNPRKQAAPILFLYGDVYLACQVTARPATDLATR